jgi:hypothetical protein
MAISFGKNGTSTNAPWRAPLRTTGMGIIPDVLLPLMKSPCRNGKKASGKKTPPFAGAKRRGRNREEAGIEQVRE